MGKLVFDDNIMVIRRKDRGDFLAVGFYKRDREADDALLRPQIVRLTRYTVPGRFDTYDFDYCPSPEQGFGDRIRYFTDTNTPLTKAIELVQKDLDKPQVVKMLLEAGESHPAYARILCDELLASIGPKTKSYRALKRLLDKQREK